MRRVVSALLLVKLSAALRVQSDPSCSYSQGAWVEDTATQEKGDKAVEGEHSCNGRNDVYNYKWEPKVCKLPDFDVAFWSDYLKHHKVLFVGDSTVRQQYEVFQSMCGGKHRDNVQYYASYYLVKATGGDSTKRLKDVEILHWEKVFLEEPDHGIFERLKHYDLVVLSTGQHFLHPGNEYVYANGTVEEFPMNAHRAALQTLRKELEKQKKLPPAVFRTFSPDHFYDGWYYSGGRCSHIKEPSDPDSTPNEYSLGTTIENHNKVLMQDAVSVFGGSSVVHVLDITTASLQRGDAHAAGWEDSKKREDCVHWCLGNVWRSVPGLWNKMLSATVKHLLSM